MEAAVPGPVSLEESRVVDDGWQQSRESPEQQGGEELSDDGVLFKKPRKTIHPTKHPPNQPKPFTNKALIQAPNRQRAQSQS